MIKNNLIYFLASCFCFFILQPTSFSQNTSIKGFAEARTSIENNKWTFGLGEQDLFITSELSDRASFLGETVFKYDAASHTQFNVSIERIIFKYNYYGNHNVLIGKHHTPLNYWNDTYHHGRLFFPTIDRPLLFTAEIIPLHTTGLSLQGHDLGKIKFGYDLMVGNGLGASEVTDNDKFKSLTAAVHIKPADKLRIGASYYHDVISKGARLHDRTMDFKVKQHLVSGSVAYFGKRFEVLTEATAAMNHTDSTGDKKSFAAYFYGGVKATKKLTPYVRIDRLHYQQGELFFTKNNAWLYLLGMRFQISYLAVIKLEYQHQDFEFGGTGNKVTAQVAMGF